MHKSNRKLNKKSIYLDNASATPIDKNILKKIIASSKEDFSNPGGVHEFSLRVKNKLEDARKSVASVLNCGDEEIVFTSGATESNNLAIRGIWEKTKNKIKKPNIIVSNIEHPSVLEVCKYLEDNELTKIIYLKVNEEGLIDLKELRKKINKNTILVSIGYANSEIGVIQPIRDVAKEIRHYRKKNKTKFPYFHSDITQAVNYLNINMQKLGVDLASFNSAKIYGPKGVGALFVKRGVEISKVSFGGEQEFGLRPGTENLPLIIGLKEALLQTQERKEKESQRLMELRDYFIEKSKKVFNKHNIKFILNGDPKKRLPNNINVSFDKIPSDLLLIELSNYGIFLSEKSACKSKEKKHSHVIEALRKENLNSLRFSLGRDTRKKDLDYVVSCFGKIFKKLAKWYN